MFLIGLKGAKTCRIEVKRGLSVLNKQRRREKGISGRIQEREEEVGELLV
jgi:hypothetical protein